MSKDPARKKKRKQPVLDDPELIELAAVLADYQLDNNAYGWFRPAWRDGECAIGLAVSAAQHADVFDGLNLALERETVMLLDEAPRDAWTYEKAGELYREFVQPKINTNTARLFAAALRCLQLKIANSHGGGAVYNEILIPAFLPIKPNLVEGIVLDFRCLDALGVTRHLNNTGADRQRAAFTIAWRRGLYLAAYSIQPVTRGAHGSDKENRTTRAQS